MIFTTLATLLLPSLAQGRHTLREEPVKTEPVEAHFQVLVSGYNRARDRSMSTLDRPLSLGLFDVDVEGRVYNAGAHVLEPGEDNMTWMEIVNGDTIYAVHEVGSYMHPTGPGLSRWTLSPDGMQKHEFVKTREGPVSLSVSVELGMVFVANFGHLMTEDAGSVQVFALDAEGVIGELVFEETYSGLECVGRAHDVVHKGNDFYVVDLGCDRIYHYIVDGGAIKKHGVFTAEPSCGPRRIALHPTEDLAFVVCEIEDGVQDILAVYAVNPEDEMFVGMAGGLTVTQRTVLDETEVERERDAEVLVHPNGKYVYVSTSRYNKKGVLTAFELDPATSQLSNIQRYELVGTSPRGVALSPDGSFMVVADEDSAVVQFVNVDPETGMLTTKRIYNTPETLCQWPAFVGFYSAPDFQPSTPFVEPATPAPHSDETESELLARMGRDWDYLMQRVEDINVKLSGSLGQSVGDISSRMRTFEQEWNVFQTQFAGWGGSLTQSMNHIMAQQTRHVDSHNAMRKDLAMQLSNMERSIEEQKKNAAEQSTQSAQLAQGMDLLTERVTELHTFLEGMKDNPAAESHMLPDGESAFWKLHQYHQGLQAEAGKRREAEDDSVKKNYAIIALSMALVLFCWFAVVMYCFQKTLIRTQMQEVKIERMALEMRAAEMAGISIEDPLEGTPGKETTVSSRPKEQQPEKPVKDQAKSTNGAPGEMLPPQPKFLTQGSKGSAFV